MKKKALITGITGQDGAYLAELLLEKGYEVHGIKRRTSLFNTARIDHLYNDPLMSSPDFYLHHGDLSDFSSLFKVVKKIKPDEVYNLAAQSHVSVSFEEPEYTANTDAMGCLRILEAIRMNGLAQKTKFYQASTSELYGKVVEVPQTEKTPFHPRSPYGVAKLFAYWTTINYREAYNMFACNGILFNHESPLRGETFVTRKITRGLAEYKLGRGKTLFLGNLYAKRDWGHAKDYVRAMWLMLQQDKPEDFVISTGRQYKVKDFVNIAAMALDIDLEWKGDGLDEHAIDRATQNVVVRISPKYFRPAEVDTLLGDASKAKKQLGWEPEISFYQMVEEMVESDLRQMENEVLTLKDTRVY